MYYEEMLGMHNAILSCLGLKAKEFLTAARGSVSRMLHCDPSGELL